MRIDHGARLFFALGSMVLVSCVHHSQRVSVLISIQGTIEDSLNARPLSGPIWVGQGPERYHSVGGVVGGSDSTGHFAISLPSPGIYYIAAHAIGYQPSERRITLPADSSLRLDFRLSRGEPRID